MFYFFFRINKQRQMKKYLLIAILFISCNNTKHGFVKSCHDGDTITLQEDGRTERIRLSSIDANELTQPGGPEARQHLADMILGKEVDVTIYTKDKYGRSVGTIYLNGIDVNEKMVTDGYAWVYRKYSSEKLYREELEARAAHLGIWKNENQMPPYLFRKLNK